MPREDEIPGPCCCCGRRVRVRNVVMLARRAPVPGKGWGCLACGLPMDGAIYVACDQCVESGLKPVAVCNGSVMTCERTPIGSLSDEVFDHDLSKHPELRCPP